MTNSQKIICTGIAGLLVVLGIFTMLLYCAMNDVSYLSFGIAVQLAVTAKGELSLEYNLEESGFMQVEVDGNGKTTHRIKGYNYPNPLIEDRKPTEIEQASTPSVTSSIEGKAKFDVAFGGDIGICILGMIPIKLANNFVELEMVRGFGDGDDKTEFIRNNYLLDDNVDSLILGSNSYLKMHFGAKVNLGSLKYSLGEIDSSTLLFKDIWYQTPPAIGFSHTQGGFGGVFVGETYSDDELNAVFKEYMKSTGKSSVMASVKDSLFGSIVNTAFNDLGVDPIGVASYLGDDIEKYKINYFTSGIIYVRNEEDLVVATFVTGETITNISGVHIGLNEDKIKQIYLAPDMASDFEIKIGTLARNIFSVNLIDDTNVSRCTYNSYDSSEKMDMLFCDGILKMIVVY